MKPNNKQNSTFLPDIQVAICYTDVYDDYIHVDPHQFIKDIPTLAILNFVVKLQNKVLYDVSDMTKQRNMVRDICISLDWNARKKVWEFLDRHKLPLLISCDTSFLMFQLALSNYVPLEAEEDDLNLFENEMEGVYKAILYCNQIWTDLAYSSQKKILDRRVEDATSFAKLLMRLDMPIVEFKFHKDFRTQIYKALIFFYYCEVDPIFSKYLPYFYKDYKINHWKEYLLQLFSFFSASLKSQYILLDDSNNPLPISVNSFFDQYTIDVDSLKGLWGNTKAMLYLRNHFLLKVSEQKYLLLNANLLVDKIYQGMKFDFFKSIKKHKLSTKEGREYSNYPQFNSVLGESFSESWMLYPFLNKCFKPVADKLIEGKTLSNCGMKGEPDFYMRVGNTLFLFELKDLTLGDSVKFSQDEEVMKQEILERICYDAIDSKGSKKRKGGGQLLSTIDNLLNKQYFREYDTGVNHINKKYNFNQVSVSDLIIIDFDTLINLGFMLYTKKISLSKILDNYLSFNNKANNISPFSSYVSDYILKNHTITKQENNFLFDQIIKL